MIGLSAIFWIMVILFGMIGSFRGWAKELMVSFSVILSIFILDVLKYLPFLDSTLAARGPAAFWVRFFLLLVLVFFGYQTPNIPKLAQGNKFARDRLQDILLGMFLGAVNAYLVFGTAWFYLDKAGYPFDLITAPQPGTIAGDAALKLIPTLAPNWLGAPTIYFAIAIAFVFVLIVFI